MEVNTRIQDELPPEWVNSAIWYQVFVERFYNGDRQNDPIQLSIEGGTVDEVPSHWAITPWEHNWYAKEDWMKNMPVDFYRGVQLRRYGGDLKGVIDKIPYFKHIGVNALYFNPLNWAPSLHKYDATYYHHIDPHFGPDPMSDYKIIESEIAEDPGSWLWTASDRLFLDLISSCHDAGIRVIMDFSFNHTGHTFWAFEDIKREKSNSRYMDWYFNIDIVKKSGQEIVKYTSWNHISTLPELNKINLKTDAIGMLRGTLPEPLKKHIFDVCSRWIDPYKDGDTSKGIDGLRLDVADLVPVDFWKELRIFTRQLNPDFFLVGEIWWEEWPEKLKDTKPWLQGDLLDSVMHYHWFREARMYFGEGQEKSSVVEYIGKIQEIYSNLKLEHCRALMNVAASHDSPRLLTSMFNVNKYKYKCKPNEDPFYKTGIPDEKTFHLTALLLIHQFTFLGCPHIWNGDEMGMIGADDPDNRKPLIWPEYHFEAENESEYSSYKNTFQPMFDANHFKLYRDLIKLRKSFKSFSNGDCLFHTDEIHVSPLLIYSRSVAEEKIYIVINRTEERLKLPHDIKNRRVLYQYNIEDSQNVIIPALSSIIFMQE